MSKSLLKSRFWQILLYCKAFSLFCGKCQAAAAIWQFAACHKNVYGTRNLTPGECRVKVPAPFPILIPSFSPERISCVWKKDGATKICNSCNFHGKFATPREQRTYIGARTQHVCVHIHVCIRICALNVKIFLCLAFQALNFFCQRSSPGKLSLHIIVLSE